MFAFVAGWVKSLDKWSHSMTSLSQPTRRFQLKRKQKDCHHPTPNHLDGRIPGTKLIPCCLPQKLGGSCCPFRPSQRSWGSQLTSLNQIHHLGVLSAVEVANGDWWPKGLPHASSPSHFLGVVNYKCTATSWKSNAVNLSVASSPLHMSAQLHFHIHFIVRVLRFTTLATLAHACVDGIGLQAKQFQIEEGKNFRFTLQQCETGA